MSFKIAEPTLGPEIANLLESLLGCKIAREGILPGRKQFDFFLILDHSRIIAELEIGGLQKLPIAIVQADEYRQQVDADGVIAIIYPEEARKEVTKPEDVRDIATALHPAVMILCPFLKQYYPQISLPELAKNLKYSLSKPSLAPSVDLVVQTLRQSVQGVALEIKRSAGIESPVIQETVGSLALFQILCQEEDTKGFNEEAIKGLVADLAAYILVNQLLLHHILSQHLSFSKLESISCPLELNRYFKEILDIDYRAIFCVDVASNMPISATPEVNTAIRAMGALQPENLRHDLLGRIFHEFLPKDTRKQLGAFYTKPQAAEILAGLSVWSADDKVLDPACGSGTLLVAAYRKKSSSGKVRSHHKIVEKEVTGVDIMPFAAHLAALNLTMQSPLEVTNKTRIGIGNSLHLAPGEEVGTLAQWMRAFGGDVTGIDIDQPSAKGDAFKLEPAHVVIMNPPFTRKERLTPEMKGVRFSSLGEQNYWGYFVALATSVLRKNGRIAAVLPRDFFRGEYSRAIREFLFKNKDYGIRYIVKSTREWAFSEGAVFRDFLVVLQKDYSGKCAVVYLKKRLDDISLREAIGIPITIQLLEEDKTFEDEEILVLWREQEEIWQNWHDLGHLVAFNTNGGEKLLQFYRDFLSTAKGNLVRLGDANDPQVHIIRGFEHGGENLQSLLYIVRPITPKRLVRSTLVLMSDEGGRVTARMKGKRGDIEIPPGCFRRGLRTSAYVPQLDVERCNDYVIIKPFAGLDEILEMFGVKPLDFVTISRKAQKRFTHLVLNRRFDLTAPGTKALAFFSDEKILPVGLHWSVLLDSQASQAMCLWFNSSFYLIELLLLHTETRGSYLLISEEQLKKLHIPRLGRCDITSLLEAFNKIRHDEFPPLAEQFDAPPLARWLIDQAVLRFIGYQDREIEALLREIYHCMAKEMKSFSDLMRHAAIAEEMPTLQLHLMATE